MTYDVSFKQLGLMALFDLKGSFKDVVAWCGKELPKFPATPSSLTRKKAHELMWIGPENWILRAPLTSEAALVVALKPDDAPASISIVRISDTMVFFAMSGPDLYEVLSVATPLDIHPSLFPPNGATFSEAFGVKALFIRDEQGIQIGVERSYGPMIADYLQRTIVGRENEG